MFDCVAVVGATGAVGTIIRELLEAWDFPCKQLKFVASARSAGKKLPYAGREITVEELKGSIFDDVQLVISSTPDDTARDYIPDAVRRGCAGDRRKRLLPHGPQRAAGDSRGESATTSRNTRASSPARTARPRKWSKP